MLDEKLVFTGPFARLWGLRERDSQNKTYIRDVFDLILGQFAQILILALGHQLQSRQL